MGSAGKVEVDGSGEEVTKLSLGRFRGDVGTSTGAGIALVLSELGSAFSDAVSTVGSARPGDTAEGGGVGKGAGRVGGVDGAGGRGTSSGLGVGICPLGRIGSASFAGLSAETGGSSSSSGVAICAFASISDRLCSFSLGITGDFGN